MRIKMNDLVLCVIPAKPDREASLQRQDNPDRSVFQAFKREHSLLQQGSAFLTAAKGRTESGRERRTNRIGNDSVLLPFGRRRGKRQKAHGCHHCITDYLTASCGEERKKITERPDCSSSQGITERFGQDRQDRRRSDIPGPAQFGLRVRNRLVCFFQQVKSGLPGFGQGIRIPFQKLTQFSDKNIVIII